MNKKTLYSMLYLMTFINLLLAANTSCGQPPYQDARVMVYVHEFEKLYDVKADSLNIRLVKGDLLPNDPGVVGLCVMNADKVFFREDFFGIADYTVKKLLVFHELGHCLLGREHKDDIYPDGCPKSIMSTFLISEACFELHQGELLEELGLNRD